MEIKLSEHFTKHKLIRFTLPTIAMMIFTSIYGVVDGLFVSNCVGKDAFAGVNLIMPAIMIAGSLGFMTGTGGSALVSKTLGEGDNKRANEIFSMLIEVLVIGGVILSAVGIVLIKQIAILLGAEGDMIEHCTVYGRTLLIAMTAFLLQNCFQAFLVAAEKPKLGLLVSISAGVTNMLLDFLFIYVWGLGVFGAAAATGISQVVGAVIPLAYFIKSKDSLRLVKARPELRPILKTCANGSSEMVTNMSMSLVNMLFNFQLMKYAGTNGVVAYGIIMYVSFIFSGTYMGYSVGSAPVIGYHYGAKNTAELKSLLKNSLILLSAAAVIMTAAAELLSRPLAGIFVSYDEELLELTVTAIRIFSLSYLISWFNIFASSFFTALNNGMASAVISFLRTLVFQIAFIYILPLFWQLNGIWLSVGFAELLSLVVSVVFLAVNRKKYDYI